MTPLLADRGLGEYLKRQTCGCKNNRPHRGCPAARGNRYFRSCCLPLRVSDPALALNVFVMLFSDLHHASRVLTLHQCTTHGTVLCPVLQSSMLLMHWPGGLEFAVGAFAAHKYVSLLIVAGSKLLSFSTGASSGTPRGVHVAAQRRAGQDALGSAAQAPGEDGRRRAVAPPRQRSGG